MSYHTAYRMRFDLVMVDACQVNNLDHDSMIFFNRSICIQ